MQKEQYIRLTLFGLSGPLLWVFHFGFVYIVQLFLCALSAEAAETSVKVLIAAVSAVIVLALILLIVMAPELTARALHLQDVQRHYSRNTFVFLSFMTRALAGLSLVAVIWSALAVLFLPACGMYTS
ncbi:MAG TPA: hypothetical protein VM553_17265 [Dongiaceae bacterium]|nr:hypothetical protein [Dongiaceae bacterium]